MSHVQYVIKNDDKLLPNVKMPLMAKYPMPTCTVLETSTFLVNCHNVWIVQQ